MIFNNHFDVMDKHSFLSPSNHHWINYDLEKLRNSYDKFAIQRMGVSLHQLAKNCIELGINLPKNKRSLNQFVNDGIGFRMRPEQILFYSYNCFGTADAICFRDKLLRIHDLKTGSARISMEQLEIYAALFCLEYEYKPQDIDIELRIYQGNKIIVHTPGSPFIKRIMEKIILFDKKIEEFKTEEKVPWLQ